MNIDVVLDTNVVLYLLRANERWLRIVEELHPRVVGVSAMTFMEVEMGIMTESEQNVSDRFSQRLSSFRCMKALLVRPRCF